MFIAYQPMYDKCSRGKQLTEVDFPDSAPIKTPMGHWKMFCDETLLKQLHCSSIFHTNTLNI